jgi:hypothetical protein
LELKKGL